MYTCRDKTKCCGAYVESLSVRLSNVCPQCGEAHGGIDNMTYPETGQWVRPRWWVPWKWEWRPKYD